MTDSADQESQRSEAVPAQPVLEYASPRSELKPPRAMPGVLRFAGVYAGVVVPAVCLAWSVAGFPFGPEWQSGRPADYVKLLLSARSGWPFWPLLGYAMVGMMLVCLRPAHFARFFAVRFAIYTGVVLAATFAGIMFLSFALENPESGVWGFLGGVVGIAVPAAVLLFLDYAVWWFGGERVVLTIVVLVGVVLVIALILGRSAFGSVLFAPLVMSLFLATPWALAVYAAVAMRVWRLARDEAPRPVVAAPAWLAAYAGAWALAVQQAIQAYQRLPTNPPSRCYVASAAARGHRRLVRSREVGGVMVNGQLRRLKCAEIALATVAPRLHRAVRRAYDRVGPVLAKGMVYPLLADLAYVALKPAEWASAWVMRRWIGGFDELASRVYGDGPASAD
jgi:hypothetical protein